LFERDLITLDFEGSEVRMLLVHGGQVARWESLTLPAEQMSQGVVHEPAAVGQALKQMLERNEIRRGRVAASVTGMRAISRMVSLPAVKEKHLEDTLRHKIRQEIPLPLDDMDLTWHVVARSAEGSEVYVLAVPRDAVDRLVETLAAAGWKAATLDVRPLALARLIVPESAVLLTMEEHSLSVLILRHGMPVVVRTVPFGISRSAVEAQLELASQELARTIKFYNEGHRDDAIETGSPIFATGESVEPLEVVEALARRHGGPVEIPPVPLPAPKDLPKATFAVNLGLALKKV
jgi:type IV pilus assembly protein PilM